MQYKSGEMIILRQGQVGSTKHRRRGEVLALGGADETVLAAVLITSGRSSRVQTTAPAVALRLFVARRSPGCIIVRPWPVRTNRPDTKGICASCPIVRRTPREGDE